MLGNKRGEVRLHAKLFDGVRQGVLIAESIWPNSAYADGCGINTLTGCRSDCAATAGRLSTTTEFGYKKRGRNVRAFSEFRPDGVLATDIMRRFTFECVNTGEEVAEPLELCGEYVTDIAFNDDGIAYGLHSGILC